MGYGAAHRRCANAARPRQRPGHAGAAASRAGRHLPQGAAAIPDSPMAEARPHRTLREHVAGRAACTPRASLALRRPHAVPQQCRAESVLRRTSPACSTRLRTVRSAGLRGSTVGAAGPMSHATSSPALPGLRRKCRFGRSSTRAASTRIDCPNASTTTWIGISSSSRTVLVQVSRTPSAPAPSPTRQR